MKNLIRTPKFMLEKVDEIVKAIEALPADHPLLKLCHNSEALLNLSDGIDIDIITGEVYINDEEEHFGQERQNEILKELTHISHWLQHMGNDKYIEEEVD